MEPLARGKTVPPGTASKKSNDFGRVIAYPRGFRVGFGFGRRGFLQVTREMAGRSWSAAIAPRKSVVVKCSGLGWRESHSQQMLLASHGAATALIQQHQIRTKLKGKTKRGRLADIQRRFNRQRPLGRRNGHDPQPRRWGNGPSPERSRRIFIPALSQNLGRTHDLSKQ
jgi:hypothetical protein